MKFCQYSTIQNYRFLSAFQYILFMLLSCNDVLLDNDEVYNDEVYNDIINLSNKNNNFQPIKSFNNKKKTNLKNNNNKNEVYTKYIESINEIPFFDGKKKAIHIKDGYHSKDFTFSMSYLMLNAYLNFSKSDKEKCINELENIQKQNIEAFYPDEIDLKEFSNMINELEKTKNESQPSKIYQNLYSKHRNEMKKLEKISKLLGYFNKDISYTTLRSYGTELEKSNSAEQFINNLNDHLNNLKNNSDQLDKINAKIRNDKQNQKDIFKKFKQNITEWNTKDPELKKGIFESTGRFIYNILNSEDSSDVNQYFKKLDSNFVPSRRNLPVYYIGDFFQKLTAKNINISIFFIRGEKKYDSERKEYFYRNFFNIPKTDDFRFYKNKIIIYWREIYKEKLFNNYVEYHFNDSKKNIKKMVLKSQLESDKSKLPLFKELTTINPKGEIKNNKHLKKIFKQAKKFISQNNLLKYPEKILYQSENEGCIKVLTN